MKKLIVMLAVSSVLGLTINRASAQTQDTSKKVQDTAKRTVAAPVQPAADVVGALGSNADYSTMAQLVKTANLEPVLQAGGPYTIFAPNNAAFSSLAAGRLDSLTKDTTKLAALLKGHIVTGRYAKADIIKLLTAGKGTATLTTIDGQSLTLSVSPTKKLQLTNAAGTTAQVVLYDLVGANGIVNGIDRILFMGKPSTTSAP